MVISMDGGGVRRGERFMKKMEDVDYGRVSGCF
jgi:hypothetical protein